MLKIKDKVRYIGLDKIGKIVKIKSIGEDVVCLVKYGFFKKHWCFEFSLEKVGDR